MAASNRKSATKTSATKASDASVLIAEESIKTRKAGLIRDSFTMPEAEYAAIGDIKSRCLNQGVAAKKSEVLRAAIAALAALSDAEVAAAIRNLDIIKTGRPAKSGK